MIFMSQFYSAFPVAVCVLVAALVAANKLIDRNLLQ